MKPVNIFCSNVSHRSCTYLFLRLSALQHVAMVYSNETFSAILETNAAWRSRNAPEFPFAHLLVRPVVSRIAHHGTGGASETGDQ